jgi:hypothetical protein
MFEYVMMKIAVPIPIHATTFVRAEVAGAPRRSMTLSTAPATSSAAKGSQGSK